MDRPEISFTAIYLKGKHGYVAFLQQLPVLNSRGQTIEEVRLMRLAVVVFDEERTQSMELLKGKDVVREQFRVFIPKI